MLVNTSANPTIKKQGFTEFIGPPLTLAKRKELGSSRSPNLEITQASLGIHSVLALEDRVHTCIIELYSLGIAMHFTVAKQTYALIIPYYKLSIYKGRSEEYSFYKDQYFLKVFVGSTDKEAHEFIKKIMKEREDNTPTSIEDL